MGMKRNREMLLLFRFMVCHLLCSRVKASITIYKDNENHAGI